MTELMVELIQVVNNSTPTPYFFGEIDDGTDDGIDMGIDDGSDDDFMGSFDPMPESDVVQDVYG